MEKSGYERYLEMSKFCNEQLEIFAQRVEQGLEKDIQETPDEIRSQKTNIEEINRYLLKIK